MTGAVTVVEEVFGVGVVNVHCWESQHAVFQHRPQAHDARGSFFGSSDQVGNLVGAVLDQCCYHVAAVVDDNVGTVIEGCVDVTFVGSCVFSSQGVDGNAVVCY